MTRVLGQRHFGEVHGRGGRAVVAVLDQLFRHFQADIGLGFHGGAADVRREDHVVHAAQWRQEFVLVALGLDREHVNGGAQQLAAFEGFSQRINIYHGAARCVDEDAALLHGRDLFCPYHAVGRCQLGHMQRHDIGLRQQRIQAAGLVGIA